MWIQLVVLLACFGSGFLLHKVLVGVKEADPEYMRTAWNIGEIGFMTGFFGDITKDPKKFVEHLERNGFNDPTKVDGKPEFTVIDDDLDLLLNLGADMVKGQCNMDTGIWWLQTLDKVLDRLRPDEAPFRDGVSTKTGEKRKK